MGAVFQLKSLILVIDKPNNFEKNGLSKVIYAENGNFIFSEIIFLF